MKPKQRVLLLGSAGYLGRTLTAYLQSRGDVVPTHRSQARFAGSYHYNFWTDDISSLVKHQQIDTVIIAASMAYEATHPSSERTLFEQQGERLVRGCQQCRVIYISSDGIFDGKRGLYKESDIPTPITLYGQNLQYLEERVQSLCSNYCIIRPSYLYGYSLSQLDARLSLVQERLLAGERLSFFTDMIKSPMEVNQVAAAITSLTYSEYIGLVHVAGEAMSVYDFHREAMSSLGIASEHLSAVQMPTDFAHPKDTSLDISLMKQLTKIEPLPVRLALQREGR
ncbi:sugar nucleotide-binding protein [Tengunoibacter tsumagoiensis]|uniref:NAD(P)-dependent oxidoreductase n=1 Tax=Tengunoibacter tsumagoiensis TaxID=2014871 RepID=A0A401ZY82_9CHLR|nr:sugar nucleotide-binding protein [Tengunoibacter tsumagoiensis]GCE11783.1 NAD(P)-dependent oxidoreductase [Tengunoibacter tsumagoiensis]